MFISRAQLRKEAFNNTDIARLMGSEYQIHRMIWELCTDSPTRSRDFLYRYRDGICMPSFFIVSSRELSNTRGLFNIETKTYSPVIRKGQNLQFSLRANPVQTKRDENGRQHRHDVVMDSKNRLKEAGIPKEQWPNQPEIIQNSGFAWLAMKGESCGFSIRDGDVCIERYLSREFIKPRKPKPVKFSTLDFEGLLTVTDEDRFLNALYNGIGPAKGFGCGLMMVQTVRICSRTLHDIR